MKITKARLKQIIKEELSRLNELGPETGHVEGTDAAGVVRQVADDLEEVAGVMNDAPSTTTASEFAGFIQSKAQELAQAADELGMGKVNEDVARDDDRFAKLAVALGQNVGGYPHVASGVRDALAKVFPKAAEQFYKAYQMAQAELDMIYSAYDE